MIRDDGILMYGRSRKLNWNASVLCYLEDHSILMLLLMRLGVYDVNRCFKFHCCGTLELWQTL